MRRLLILISLSILIIAPVHSQFRIGLRGGINMAYFDASKVETANELITAAEGSITGYHGGVITQISFFGLFIQPELLITSISSEFIVDRQGSDSEIATQKYTRLDFPVMAGKRFGPVRVGVGPIGTVMLQTTSDLKDMGIVETFNAATFGFQAGAGIDLFSKIAIDVKYEGNLTKLGNKINVGGQELNFDSRGRQLIVSLGYFF